MLGLLGSCRAAPTSALATHAIASRNGIRGMKVMRSAAPPVRAICSHSSWYGPEPRIIANRYLFGRLTTARTSSMPNRSGTAPEGHTTRYAVVGGPLAEQALPPFTCGRWYRVVRAAGCS